LTANFPNQPQVTRVKSILLFTAILSMISAEIMGQTTLTDEQKKVHFTITEAFQGLADSDLAKLKQHCTPDIVILEQGVVWNMDTIESRIVTRNKDNYKRINALEFTGTTITGNMAYTYFNNRADITSNGQSTTVKWLESAILIKEGDEWKIKLLHSTLLERIKK
jgi:ketosteroid isomerase-like protein